MQFNVHINCDNAAFTDPAGEEDEDSLKAELVHILRALRVKVTKDAHPLDHDESYPYRLFDTNGNSVGVAYFEED